MASLTLVCWSCGAQQSMSVPGQPQFGFELAVIAKVAGWIVVFDTDRARVLIFCSEECRKAQRTKHGYRLRPKRVAQKGEDRG